MKKYKTHLISIFIIVIMLIFGLSTTQTAYLELKLANKSSQTLKFRITRQERWQSFEYTEEFTLYEDESIELKKIKDINTMPKPDHYFINIAIYNEGGEIIKEYSKLEGNENLSVLNFNREKKNGSVWYYTLEITDALLE